MFVRRLLAGLVLATALGCGGYKAPTSPTTGGDSGGGGGGGGGGATGSVTVANFLFNPASLTVAPGTTVTWTWAAGAVDHNVTFDDGEHSATQSSGTYQRVFMTAGTYPYHCTIHGAQGMVGTIIVSAGGAGGTGGGSGGGGTGGGAYGM